MAKTERWTLAEIKRKNTESGYFFFSKATMRFFKETMRDWKVIHRDNGEVVVCRKRGGRDGKERIFNPETGSIY